jgi:UDP-N-acetylmuramyl pentapeptide phosphotransferase/UDP-N-acetylglucosamine-1-phosphate transferase
MIYCIITVILFVALLAYFRIAEKYRIVDQPNQRSSHTHVTIRGGGIIFPLAAVLYVLFFQRDTSAWVLLSGMLCLGMISFLDDIHNLPNKIRILGHFISVTALLYALQAFYLPVWIVLLCYVLIIGTLNAYNFMDGINGLTGIYSLVSLASLLYFNEYIKPVSPTPYILTGMIACLIFLFFNFRTKAACFAGDVGSMTLGFWMLSLLLPVIIATSELKYVLLLSVYGVDTVLTILHRLILRENIFKAHRLHFYQLLANEGRYSHLLISLGYGMVQLLINMIVLFTHFNFGLIFLLTCIPLAVFYLVFKPRLMALK